MGHTRAPRRALGAHPGLARLWTDEGVAPVAPPEWAPGLPEHGPEPGDREYAVHDTHMALLEAKQRGITPFALTVDKEGNDYLGSMCGDVAYEVLGDIELLPSRLPALYRMLTG